jgi:hypothetical protein
VSKSTVIGHVNPQQQRVIRRVGPSPAREGRYTFELECLRKQSDGTICGHRYGANDFDIDGAGAGRGRKCPACQGGAAGDPIPDDEYEDFGDPVGNVPFDMDYVLALERAAASLTTLQKDLLGALVAAPTNELSGGQIARLLGLEHHAGLNSAIVGLARTLTKAVGIEPPKRADGTPRWWHVVAEGRHSEHGFSWRLRPALRDAAVITGIALASDNSFPEENEGAPLFEGTLRVVHVNAYERNPIARRRCIEHHGTACGACGQRLADLYGSIAEGVIHVHHLRPLSECGGKEYQVDPITELRPVCPNCHTVLHLRQPPLTIEELRAVLAERRATSV